MKTDSKIRNLKKGHCVELSCVGNVAVIAERSGDGKRLTIYRTTENGWEVIRREAF